jgi:hypothetical protein
MTSTHYTSCVPPAPTHRLFRARPVNCVCVGAPSQRDVVSRPQGLAIDRNFSPFPIVRIK